jgi:hypothetical protein
MQDNHLAVPTSSGGTATGRPRSGSNRSQGSRESNSTPAAPAHDYVGQQDYFRQPSIRIRRLPSLQTVTEANTQANTITNTPNLGHGHGQQGNSTVGRSRSNSAPQRLHIATGQEGQEHLAGVTEETISPTTGRATHSIPAVINNDPQPENLPNPPGSRMSRRLRRVQTSINPNQDDYEDGLVDYLDVVGMRYDLEMTKTHWS